MNDKRFQLQGVEELKRLRSQPSLTRFSVGGGDVDDERLQLGTRLVQLLNP